MKHFQSFINGSSSFQGIVCSSSGMVLPYKVTLSSFMYYFAVSTCMINAVIGLMTVLANSLVIIAIIRCKKLIRKIFYKGLLFMAVTDFFTGLIAQPLNAAHILMFTSQTADPQSLCILAFTYRIIAVIFVTLSCNGILFITIERFLSTCFPIKHKLIMKPSIALLIMCMLQTSTLVLMFLLFTGKSREAEYVLGFIFDSYFFIVGLLYCFILKAIRSSHKRLQGESADKIKELTSNTSTQLEQRLARRFSVILIALFVCYSPFGVVTNLPSETRASSDFIVVRYATSTCVFLNSLINPFCTCGKIAN